MAGAKGTFTPMETGASRCFTAARTCVQWRRRDRGIQRCVTRATNTLTILMTLIARSKCV
jgi:hypothetical protein